MKIIGENYRIDILFDETKMKDILNDYYDCTRVLLNPVMYIYIIILNL